MATVTKPKTKTELTSGADILVQSLINHGVDTIFAYPGGASMPLHQALTRFSDQLRTILPRHEQGGGFAAQGIARSTGKPGVCMATSGPGATNLVTAIADAKLDSIPLIAITGQVPTKVIGTDAFQETPIVEVCRGITKHHYLVTDVNDLARVVKEAFHIATTGRPGPVLIDMPKDVQQAKTVPDYDVPMDLPGYQRRRTRKAKPEQIRQIAAAIKLAKRPIIYAGGGIISGERERGTAQAGQEDGHPRDDDRHGPRRVSRATIRSSLDMLGMHGTVYANYAVERGRPADRARRAVRRPRDGQGRGVLQARQDRPRRHRRLGDQQEQAGPHSRVQRREVRARRTEQDRRSARGYFGVGRRSARSGRRTSRSTTTKSSTASCSSTRSTSCGSSPATATRSSPSAWASTRCGPPSSTSSTKPRHVALQQRPGHDGLRPARGDGRASSQFPDKLVIDIDGDGSFQMNIQELATCFCEKLPVKVLLLNNQHLGMVVQWEDRFMQGNRAHTYLGPIDHPEARGQGDGLGPSERYPELRGDRQGLRLRRGLHPQEGRSGAGARRDDQLPRPVRARRRSALPRARAADDPRRA